MPLAPVLFRGPLYLQNIVISTRSQHNNTVMRYSIGGLHHVFGSHGVCYIYRAPWASPACFAAATGDLTLSTTSMYLRHDDLHPFGH